MMITILSSCGTTMPPGIEDPKSSATDNNAPVEAETIVLEHAYIGTEIPLENTGRGYMDVIVANGRIYYMANEPVTETNEDGTTNDVGSLTKIISVAVDGSDEQTHWKKEFNYPVFGDENNPGEMPEIVEYEGISTFGVDAAGNLWMFKYHEAYKPNDDSYRESKALLSKYGPDGTELATADITEATNGSGYFYSNTVCFNAEGDLCTSSDRTVYVFDSETAELDFTIEEMGYINSVISTNKGEVVIIVQPQMEMEIKTIDFAAKKAGPAQIYTGSVYFNTVAPGSGDYSFYTTQSDCIYGVKLETMTTDVVVSFINSDVDSSNITRLASTPDGDFIVSSHDWNNNESSIVYLTPNPDPVVTGKQLITIGAVYLDYTTRAVIRQFNLSSTTARISVIDYSQYNTAENYNAGMTKLDMDILGGKAPDIICFQGLQPEKYASKGILEDMLPYIEADPDIMLEDLFDNIIEAGKIDGKLYRLITTFSISSLVGKTSIVGNMGEFTAAKLNEIATQYPDAEIMSLTSADNWLMSCLSMALSDYIDWTTGLCSFNSPEFIELLKTSTLFPKEINYDAIYNDYENYNLTMNENLRDNKTLLQNSGLNRIREIRSTLELFGEDISFVGYPTKDGGGSLIYPQQDYGISASSKNKDAAWSFIKMFLTGEVDSMDRWSQSISRKEFEQQATDEMIPLADRDFSKGVEIVEFFPGGGASMMMANSLSEINLTDYPNYELTQKEVDLARSVIESATRVYASDQTIMGIITEELAAFMGGAKTAEDVAQIIQSRVSIYVSEHM